MCATCDICVSVCHVFVVCCVNSVTCVWVGVLCVCSVCVVVCVCTVFAKNRVSSVGMFVLYVSEGVGVGLKTCSAQTDCKCTETCSWFNVHFIWLQSAAGQQPFWKKQQQMLRLKSLACTDPADGFKVGHRAAGGAAGEDLRRLLWDLHLSAASAGDGGHRGSGSLHRQVQTLLRTLPQAHYAGEPSQLLLWRFF